MATRGDPKMSLINLIELGQFLVANRNSIRGFVRPLVGPSVRRSRVFLTARNASMMYD